MKKILITGANSYIGTSVEKWLMKEPENYQVDTLDMQDENWRNYDFSPYDVVFHVAGIAHSDRGKISDKKKLLYYKINTNLTIETAKKAKNEGVKQFIFMSSSIVYGGNSSIGGRKKIDKSTLVSPSNSYGDSKLKAENGIIFLENDVFKVCILRPPMIYGKGCKGNYNRLSRLAKVTPFFPNICNLKSILYIGNMVEFVKLMIQNEEKGIFWPQNKEYTSTSNLVNEIGKVSNHKVRLIDGFTWLFKLIAHFSKSINKVFGDFIYEQSLSNYKIEYRNFNFEDSIELSEVETYD